MTSVLVMGFLLGMRHALDADHLAAVANLVTRGRNLRGAIFDGAVWGLGHTATLALVGGVCLALGAAVPDGMAAALEVAVGVMLMALGAHVFWRLRRDRIHVHAHRHADGTVHVHAHAHASGERHAQNRHNHPHTNGFPVRPLLVGLVHGLAGSAALLLLALEGAGTAGTALVFILLFGAGSILGMAVLSVAMAVPLRASERLLAGMFNGMETAVGSLTIGVGLWVLVSAAGALY